MNAVKTYEHFPAWMVTLSNLTSILLYLLGIFVTASLSRPLAGLYLIYIVALEFRLIRFHCTDCYYYGKVCGFGKGKVSAWFFKKGNGAGFCNHVMTWKEMIPDMLVSAIPVIAGIVSMIIDFKLSLLVAVILLLIITTVGNSFVRGSISCKYCRQREMGCPAEKLFSQKNQG
jgi:hypothetical protein